MRTNPAEKMNKVGRLEFGHKEMYPVIDYLKCSGSLACYEVCPVEAFYIHDVDRARKVIVTHPEYCIECKWCVEACPEDAVNLLRDN